MINKESMAMKRRKMKGMEKEIMKMNEKKRRMRKKIRMGKGVERMMMQGRGTKKVDIRWILK